MLWLGFILYRPGGAYDDCCALIVCECRKRDPEKSRKGRWMRGGSGWDGTNTEVDVAFGTAKPGASLEDTQEAWLTFLSEWLPRWAKVATAPSSTAAAADGSDDVARHAGGSSDVGAHGTGSGGGTRSSGGGGSSSGQELRPGDWICKSCLEHNFAKRIVCRRCKECKPDDAGAGGCEVNYPDTLRICPRRH